MPDKPPQTCRRCGKAIPWLFPEKAEEAENTDNGLSLYADGSYG